MNEEAKHKVEHAWLRSIVQDLLNGQLSLMNALIENKGSSYEDMRGWTERILSDWGSMDNDQNAIDKGWIKKKGIAPWEETEEKIRNVHHSEGRGGSARQLAETYGCRVMGINRRWLEVLQAWMHTRQLGLEDKVTFCHGLLPKISFPDKIFDIVWGQEFMVYCDESLLNECARVLKPNGKIAFQVHANDFPDKNPDKFSEPYEAAGFSVEKIEKVREERDPALEVGEWYYQFYRVAGKLTRKHQVINHDKKS
jgi:SAM-dependent methyltransferase